MKNKLTNDLKKIVEWFFPEVVNASSNFFSLLWIFIYALSLALFAFQFRPLLEKYNENDVLVSVDVSDVMQLELPQVTICPGRLFAKSHVMAVKQQNLYELPIIDLTQEEYVKRVLSVKSKINVTEAFKCPARFFECTKITQCIPDVWVCDGNKDCVDESDELTDCNSKYGNETDEYCMKNWGYQRCANVSLTCAKFCNRDNECKEREDEKSCSITYEEKNLHAKINEQRILSHEHYPLGSYDNSMQKSYIISPMNETYPYIQIQFKSFRLASRDKEQGCIYDYITISASNDNSKNDLRKYCGAKHPNTTKFTGPVNITFHSDFAQSKSGFEITYRAAKSKPEKFRRMGKLLRGFQRGSKKSNPPKHTVSKKLTLKYYKLTFQWKEIYNNLTKKSPVDFSKINKYLVFDSKVPHNFGTAANDFIVKASTPRHLQVIKDPREFLNAKCGKCYVIPANLKQRKRFNAADSGIDSGISLILFVNENEDIGFYDRVRGSSITINEHGTYPLPHKNGILIKTGMTTRISLRKKTIKRRNGEINCTDKISNWDPLGELKMAVAMNLKNQTDYEYVFKDPSVREDPFNDWPNYSQDVCFEYCLHEHIRDRCNCVNSYFNLYYLYYKQEYCNPETPFPMCNPSNKSQIDCVSDVTESFYSLERKHCDCPRACNDVSYQVKMAYGDFLSKQSMYYFINEVIDSQNEAPKKLMTSLLTAFLNNTITEEELLTKIRNNFAKIEIYFEDLQHDIFNERLAYSSEQLLSAFAGNIGMFVGWSVLTFSQVSMVFFHLAYHLFLKVLQKIRKLHH